MKRFRTSIVILFFSLIGLFFLSPVQGSRPALAAQPAPAKPELKVTDRLAEGAKEVIVETSEWKAVFSVFYNGGIYQLYDKVNDPEMKDNLLSDDGGGYSQGGLFDYDVYLEGGQEFMTTMGRNADPGRARLEILENSPVRLRLRQFCHPRLNNGQGPRNDKYLELDMVATTTEWTFHPTGRVNIKFDAVVPEGWSDVVAQGPGGDGKGISTDGYLINAVNGTDFSLPWVTVGDTIECKSGGWGPLPITRKQTKLTLRVPQNLPKGDKLDYVVRRPMIDSETISIHADGSPSIPNRKRRWDGGSNGVSVFTQGGGEKSRGGSPPYDVDYVYAHWTLAPRGFGSLLAFNEPYPGVGFAVMNDYNWGDISYTQMGVGGRRAFQPHHRHFLVQMGIENGKATPRIKGIPDSLPFADDYRNPYAEARTGSLLTGEGVSKFGYHVPTGAYHIAAKNKVAAIAFDAARGKTVPAPLAYPAPSVLVSGLDVPDKRLAVELSKDNGKTYKALSTSDYLVTTAAQASQLGAKDRRLFLFLGTVPATAAGKSAWVFRLRAK